MKLNPLLPGAFLLVIGCASPTEAPNDETASSESDLTAPAPSGTFRVEGISHGGHTDYVSINGGDEEIAGSSGGGARDGYYSWERAYYEVTAKKNPDGTLAVTINGVAGVLHEGVNSYAGKYSGTIGTRANSFNVSELTAGRWNSVTGVVSDVRLKMVETTETVGTRTYWERNPNGPPDRQVTARTRTTRWSIFESGGLPGLHR